MFKKTLFFLLLIFTFFYHPSFIKAQEEDLNIHLFWSKTCPHCEKEKVFLKTLEEKYPTLKTNLHEITDPNSQELFQEAGQILSVSTSSIPFTVIGNNYLIGYDNQDNIGRQIETLVENCLEKKDCPNILTSAQKETVTPSSQKDNPPKELSLPFIGKIEIKTFSLPLLTFLIALVDGFNPCAMWTLLFLISLLLNMKDKKRMWILGFSFIVASAFIYFLFMSAWLNFFLFVGLISWVRIIIGLVAIFAAYYQIKDFLVNKKGGCKTTDDEKRMKTFEKLKSITQKNNLFVAIVGITLLAFAVNLVELLCSAGLPAIYTQILTMNNLPPWQYYFYLLFYTFIFMLDDMVVFFIAMRTLHAVGIEGKYARFSRLVGGIIALVIGLLMIFKPELLSFV